jgi:hypothetical protein
VVLDDIAALTVGSFPLMVQVTSDVQVPVINRA